MEPGLIEIRPLRITEIISAALRALIKNPRATLGSALNFGFLLGLISLFGLYLNPLDESLTQSLAELNDQTQISNEQLFNLLEGLAPSVYWILLSTAALYILQTIVTGIVAPTIGFLITGTKLSRNEAWLRVKPQLGNLTILAIVILLLEALVLITPILIASLLVSFLPGSVSTLLISISFIVSLGLLIYVFTILLLAPSVLILENTSIKLSLLRSRELVTKSFARVFFGTLWASIIAQALAILIQLPFTVLSQIYNSSTSPTTISIFTDTIGSVIGFTFVLAFFASFITLLYTDQRIRFESFGENLKSVQGH